MAIPIQDNHHPWEKAYVGVFAHPFFAVTDAFGHYQIPDLPPGSHKVIVWHEALGEKTEEVVVVEGESRFVGFTFSAADLKP